MQTHTLTPPAIRFPIEGAVDAPLLPDLRTRPSRIALRFAHLVTAMDVLITADRDMIGFSGADPALDAWFRDAERALDHTLSALEELLVQSPRAPGDIALIRVARLIRKVIRSSDPDLVARLRRRVIETPMRYLALDLPGLDPVVNRLILQGLSRFESYLAVEDMPPTLDLDDGAPALSDPTGPTF
jgi:hypothetical protein